MFFSFETMKKNSFINALGLKTNKLFWVGAHKYFVQDQTKVGKQILLQANIEEDKNAKYGLAIALLCEPNDEGIQLLLDRKSVV